MRRALLAAFFLAVPVFLRAHDTWLLPARWTLPAGQRVLVDLTSAMDFPTPETPPHADRLVEKRMRLGGALSPLEVLQAESGAKVLQLAATPAAGGLATLWITTRPRTLDLKPNQVEHYLQETVTAARVAGGLRTYLDGPGGGLVYVQWDGDGLVCGVSMRDLKLEPAEAEPAL